MTPLPPTELVWRARRYRVSIDRLGRCRIQGRHRVGTEWTHWAWGLVYHLTREDRRELAAAAREAAEWLERVEGV